MPAALQARRSSSNALAVIARIGRGLPARQGTDGAGGFDAVHVGHLHVHQNQIVLLRLRLLQRLAAVAAVSTARPAPCSSSSATSRLIGLSSASSSLTPPYCTDAIALRHRPRPWAPTAAGMAPWPRCRRAVNQKQLPSPRRAVSADFSTHQFGQPPGDGEAEAGAAILARGRGVGLLEGLEQPGSVRARCRCRCPDLEAHQQFIAAVFHQPGAQGDGACSVNLTALPA
jgi:hypothetical protein